MTIHWLTATLRVRLSAVHELFIMSRTELFCSKRSVRLNLLKIKPRGVLCLLTRRLVRLKTIGAFEADGVQHRLQIVLQLSLELGLLRACAQPFLKQDILAFEQYTYTLAYLILPN